MLMMKDAESDTFSITNKTNGSYSIPELPFSRIKKTVLGAEYDLSLVFIQDGRSATLNEKYRNKEGPTNVLSFDIGDDIGEIYINLDAVSREYESYADDAKSFAGYLFIHGMLHLKGYPHGSKMDKQEQRICEQFEIQTI
jgi:probable rRNA maturation factor